MNALFPLGWMHYLIGGLVIGAGVSLMFVFTGRVTGMSSVFTTTWSYVSRRDFFQQSKHIGSRAWRLVLALGLILGATLWWWWLGPDAASTTQLPWWQLLAGGFLVGYGARLSDGCTSGHGICGLASLSLPSLAAVITFVATAMATANIVAALGGR
jgi:uncharacterized membrane protein YedE/YeeE